MLSARAPRTATTTRRAAAVGTGRAGEGRRAAPAGRPRKRAVGRQELVGDKVGRCPRPPARPRYSAQRKLASMEAIIASMEAIMEPWRTTQPDRVARIQAEWRPRTPGRRHAPAGRDRPVAPPGRPAQRGTVPRVRRYGLSEGEFDVLCRTAPRRAALRTGARRARRAHHGHHRGDDEADRPSGAGRAGHPPAAATTTSAAGSSRSPAPGRELIDRAFTDHMRNERQLLDALPPSEAASLETLLATWLATVRPPAPPAQR